jgi:hypothetical protein
MTRVRGPRHLPRHGVKSRNRAWYRTDPDRLEREKALLCKAYPSLAFFVDDGVQTVRIEGILPLKAHCGVTEEIRVRIDYPHEYPRRLPIARDPVGRFEPSPNGHINKDGSFCLTLPLDKEFDLDSTNFIVDFVDAVALFVDRELIYEVTGQWPGPEWGHGGKGVQELMECEFGTTDTATITRLADLARGRSSLSRNAECPCGSGRKYKHCHLKTVRELRARLPRPD